MVPQTPASKQLRGVTARLTCGSWSSGPDKQEPCRQYLIQPLQPRSWSPQPQERRRPEKLAESHCLPSPTVQTDRWQQQEEVEPEIHFSDTLMGPYITRYKWGHSAEYRQWVDSGACVDSWLVHQIHHYPDPGPLGAPVMLQKNVPATGLESSSDTLSPSVCPLLS